MADYELLLVVRLFKIVPFVGVFSWSDHLIVFFLFVWLVTLKEALAPDSYEDLPDPVRLGLEIVDGILGEGHVHHLVLYDVGLGLLQGYQRVVELLDGLC